MEIPVNELLQWGGGALALAVQWGVMKTKISTLEERLSKGSNTLDRHSEADTQMLAAIARVEAKVDGMSSRLERVENRVLNGHG